LHLLKQDEEHESSSNKKNLIGKVLVGFGEPVYLKSDGENQDIASEIQREQKKAVILSPVSLIAAILLFSRVQGNMIDLGK
jgi:glycerol-3-phosphate O-acyltransferase